MLAQTTDSGGNNGTMASELQSMFDQADEPVSWDASTHHVRCYAHKLNLVVGHGLKALGQKVSRVKPSTPHGVSLPIPGVEVNDGKDDVEYGSESDEDEDDLPDDPDGVDDEEEEEHEVGGVGYDDTDDIVALALKKVRLIPPLLPSYSPNLNVFSVPLSRRLMLSLAK